MQNKFLGLIQKHETTLKKDNKIFNLVGYAKLFLVLLMGVFIYFTFTGNFPLALIILCVAALIVLVILWVYQTRLRERIHYAKGMIAVCNRHINRITGQWTAFKDIGAELMDTDHAYACDLDVVGQKSLFQYLNTTHTWHGRQTFANDLLQPAYDRLTLEKRQEAIAELSKDIEFSNMIEYYFSKVETNSSTDTLVDELKDNTPFIKRRLIKILLTCVPMFSLILIAGIVGFEQKNLYPCLPFVLIVQTALWVAGMPKTHTYLGAMARLPYKLSAYSEAIDMLTGRDFSSAKLKQIQEELKTAAKALKDLSRIADKINVKHSGILYYIVNITLLWDYQCAFLLEKWKHQYAHLAEPWFMAVGEFESLLCFSHLPNICDHTCLPVFSEEKNKIEATEIGHPLLLNENRVNNDFHFDNKILIVSGSNMSGKTTFLRTVGINLVLARCGGFVCAAKMTCSPLAVVTSMRIADDLSEGVSTFYAELTRIKRLIDLVAKQPDILFLIDEIFRGTNSVDRLTGATAVITKLNALGAAGLISTHDLALCELSNTYDRIKNGSFSEHYRDNKIYFDYKMKPGKSNTTNAKFLMEMVGIT